MSDRCHSRAVAYVSSHIERHSLTAPSNTEKLLEVILVWFTKDDLDIHLYNQKSGEHIYYSNKQSIDRKINLLIDENASASNASDKVKEYLYIRRGIESSTFNLVINNYCSRVNGNSIFAVHIQTYKNGEKGEVYSYDSDPGVTSDDGCGKGLENNEKATIATININNDNVEVEMYNPQLKAKKSDTKNLRPPPNEDHFQTTGGYLPICHMDLIARQKDGYPHVALRFKPNESEQPVMDLASGTPIHTVEANDEWVGIQLHTGTVHYLKRRNTESLVADNSMLSSIISTSLSQRLEETV